MKFFDNLFRRPPKNRRPATTLDGWWANYSQYGTDVYEAVEVQQALKCIVDEIKKLNPTHVRINENNDPVPVKSSSVADVLKNPNPLMTTAEFLEKITWLLLLNYNVFIIPVYYTWLDEKTGAERRYYTELYPIKPERVDFIQDASDTLFVQFWFASGENTTIKYSDCIHIRYNYSVNEYMGGNMLGQPDNDRLKGTLDLNKDMLTGVAKAMKASYAINGIIKYNTLIDDGTTVENLAKLEQKLKNSESGFLPLDLKADFTPLERKSQIVNTDALKFIDEKILRNFGVPLCILTGDFTKEQYEAFYQKSLEPIIVTIKQAFTKKLFTDREKAFGNRVELYPKELIFLSVQQTIEMINILAPTGALYENEKRVALGLRPDPALEGKRYMSLNWIEADKAAAYQTGVADGDDNVKIVAESE